MTRKQIGWFTLVVGGALQVAETMGKADAVLQGVNYNQTTIGQIVAPIETVLPVSLGWSVMLVGAALVWVIPWVEKAG